MSEPDFHGLIVPGLPVIDWDTFSREQTAPPPTDFAEAFHVELVRRTMELFDQAVWSETAIVTTDEAQQVVDKVRAEQRLEDWLEAFKASEPAEPMKVVMNRTHFEYARWLYRRPPAYCGGMDPALFGYPVEIDDTADKPRLEPL